MPNDNPSGLGSFPFNHRFSGQYYDQESALHQNWHRDYNPQLGRYLQSDLLGLLSGYSTYGYAKLNPIQRNDPLGFAPCLTWATGAESFLHDLGTAVVHAAAGSGLLGPCLQRYSRQLESNVASNASLIAEALADKNFLHNALTAAGIAVDDASEAILGRMLTAAAATWMTGSAASVLALSGSVLNHLGGISPDVMARVVASIQNREISPEVVQIIRELAEIAAGSC
jgi:RHS repeat-associated protein